MSGLFSNKSNSPQKYANATTCEPWLLQFKMYMKSTTML